jgi:hypothetical protein
MIIVVVIVSEATEGYITIKLIIMLKIIQILDKYANFM